MSFLIDTNVISEVRKGARCDENVARWYSRIGDEDLYLSVIVMGETCKGIELARPKNPAKAEMLEAWLEDVIVAFAGSIFDVDKAVMEEWGRINAIRTVPVIDALLAATAKTHRLTLVTRNAPDVAGLGVDILNPFDAL